MPKACVLLQTRFIAARTEVEGVVRDLVVSHKEKVASQDPAADVASRVDSSHTNGTVNGLGQSTKIRRGVAPGSFIDLLVQRGNTETGQKFSDECIIQQVVFVIAAPEPLPTLNMLQPHLHDDMGSLHPRVCAA